MLCCKKTSKTHMQRPAVHKGFAASELGEKIAVSEIYILSQAVMSMLYPSLL